MTRPDGDYGDRRLGHVRAALGLCLILLPAPWTGASEGGEDASSAPGKELREPGPVTPDAVLTGEFSLSEEAQTYLWDVEHLAFVMGQDVVPAFKKAMAEGDAGKLLGFLAPDFRARLFEGPGERVDKGLVTYEAWDAGARSREVGRDAFAAWITSHGREFDRVDGIGFHIYYISPDERGKLDGGWESRWEGHVSGVLGDGARAEHRLSFSFHMSRLREDMATDTGWIDGLTLLKARRVASPRGLLEEITARTGIDVDALADNWNQEAPPYHPAPGSARLLDYDRDGRVDLLLTEVLFVPRRVFLYRGLGDGTFDDVTDAVGLRELAQLGGRLWLAGSLVADLDDDGYEDVIFSVEQEVSPGQKAHALAVYRNVGGQRFEMMREAGHELGQRFNLGQRGLAVADFDNDGRVDLFLGPVGPPPPPEHRKPRWLGDRSSRDGVLLRNLGNFRFEDVSAAVGISGQHIDISSATWLDLEPDGDADLFLGNHMGPNVLWENLGGADGATRFAQRPQPPGFGGFSMGATAGDLDGDGDPDLYVANMYTSAGARIIDNLRPEDYPPGAYELIRGFATGNELYANDADRLRALGKALDVANGGWAYGPELIDLDGDGQLDIYSPAGYQSVQRGEPDG